MPGAERTSAEGGPLRCCARRLGLLLTLLPAAWLALPAGVALGEAGQDRALDGRLILTKQSIEPGQRVGLKVGNTGEVTMLFGVGASIERRQEGRWVKFREACPRGCPAIGLIARPGETVGPRYGRGLRDNVRLPPTAPQGRYRLTKRVSANRSRREIHLRAVVRVRTGRLILTKPSIEPGQRVGMKVRNTSRRRIEFGLGTTPERWEGGRWVDARDEVCPDGCPVPDVGLVARPGETVGPRYGGNLRDILRFPRAVPEGLYRITKHVRRANQPRRRTIELHARLRVRAP